MTSRLFLDIAEPFGEFQYGDAQGHKRVDYAKAVLAHAAQLLREQGERETTYQLQDAFNRAAKILEDLE